MVEDFFAEEAFFEVANGLIAVRAVFFEEARLVFTHAAGDFFDRLVECCIHVFALGVGLDGDVVGAKQNDFGDMSVFLHVENCFGFDDPRVIEMQAFDFFMGVIAEGIGHLFVPHRDGDWQVDVGSLHGFLSFGW